MRKMCSEAIYLVTGATGFIGSHLVDRLLADGLHVRCLVRRTSSLQFLPRSGFESVHGDLLTGEGLHESLTGAHTVFHLAGAVKAVSPKDFLESNVRATANLLEEAANAKVRRVVHVSSVSAAGPSRSAKPTTEVMPPVPISQYGRAKLESELTVLGSRLFSKSVIVRPSAVYGPRDSALFPFIRAVRRGRILQVGRSTRRFHLTHVRDVVEGLCAAATWPPAGGQIFYLTPDDPVTWIHFGAATAEALGCSARPVIIPRTLALGLAICAEFWSRATGRAGFLTRDQIHEACSDWVFDNSLAKQLLDFHPITPLKEGLRETLDWYESQGWFDH